MDVKQKIVELYNDSDYQALSAFYNKTTVLNVFGIERSENRHSAFLRWLIDSRSNHGLGYEPIKKLLRLYALVMPQEEDVPLQNLLLVGDYDLSFSDYPTTEKSIDRSVTKKGRFDLWARMELTDRQNNKLKVVLVIENKIYSKEGADQTLDYHSYLSAHLDEDEFPIEIFLTQTGAKAPDCPAFKHISYQQLLQTVLEPLQEVVVETFSKTIISDYIRNLGKPATGENGKDFTVLATSEKEISRLKELYNKFQPLFWPALVAGNLEQVSKYLNKPKALALVSSLVSVGLINSVPPKATVKACRELLNQMESRELLESIWNDNEELFTAIFPYIPQPSSWPIDLTIIKKRSNRDNSRYSVTANGKSYGQRLAKNRAALAVFKAYVASHPGVSLDQLRDAFKGEMNTYYSLRLYKHLFYPAANVDPEFDVDGKMQGRRGDIRWDFFFAKDDLLVIDDGKQKVMAVKMWRKEAFDNLIASVQSTPGLNFIKIENS